MSNQLSRRGFLRALGIGASTAIVAPELLLPEPEAVRRFWQVGRNAPVNEFERYRTLAPRDAWAHASGYRAKGVTEVHINGIAYDFDPASAKLDMSSDRDWPVMCEFVVQGDSRFCALRNVAGTVEVRALDLPGQPVFVGGDFLPQADGSVTWSGESLSPAIAMRRQIEDRLADWERRGFVHRGYAEAFKKELVRA